MKRIYKVIFVLMFAFLFVGLSQAKADSAVTAIDGASIRVKTDTSDQGLRFYAELGESVKNNEHGFYLVYGKATVTELENQLLEVGSGTPILNNKEVFKVVVPGVNAENRYSVVLTGIPEGGYFDEITVIPFVKDGDDEVFVYNPVRRSVAAVVLNMANDGQDVSKVDGLTSITQTDKKKVGVNAFGELEISSGVYEVNHLNLRNLFIADWNVKFGTDWTELDASAFFNSAKEGLEGAMGDNKDLSPSNLYKFFKDPANGKWEFLLNMVSGVHPDRQAKAILGDGTNEDFALWHASHLSYTIANFFNGKNDSGGYDPMDFSSRDKYDDVISKIEGVYVDFNKYEFYDVGQSLVVPVAPEEKVGYTFEGYKIGESTLNPGALHVIGADAILKPDYKPINYTVKFYDGDNELSSLATNYNIESGLTLQNPSIEGKSFRGWYDNAQFTGNAITKIDAGTTGNKEFYAQFGEGNIVTYDLGDYGYHTSEKTKQDLIVEFATDYKTLFGRGASVDSFVEAFFKDSYLPEQYKFEDIFTFENGKYKWIQDHILSVAAKTGYVGAGDLMENSQAAWRANIEGFFNETEATTGYSHLSIDFTMEKNAHNFWKYTEYGEYEGDFVAGGALFNQVKTDSEIYGFVGWVDGDGAPVTQLPAEAGDYKYFAKWERSAFYVRFNIGYDAAGPATQLVDKNDKVVKPADPERPNYTFAGWFKDDAFAAAYDFNDGVTEEMTIYAKWNEVAGGAEYNITYNLDGGKIVYGTKTEMINAFLEDFYAYLKLDSSMSDFKHGPGNNTGFDGLWHSTHKASLYDGARPDAVNEALFISSAAYMDKWLPFFDMIHAFVVDINSTQFFFGSGTYVGLIRIREYIANKPPAGATPEQMNMMPEPLIEAEPIVKGKVGIEVTLQAAYKEDKNFAGWYTNPEFTGEAVTKLNPESAEDVTLYAKFV